MAACFKICRICFLRNSCRTVFNALFNLNRWHLPISIISHPKYTAVLSSQVESSLESECIKHKHHPGLRNIGCVEIPRSLQNAVNNILLQYSGKQLQVDAEKLANFLKFRQLPVNEMELKMKAMQIEKEIAEEQGIDFLNLDEEEKEKVHRSLKKKVFQKLNFLTYNWKPLNYDAYNGILYIVGRLAPNYAALQRVFKEMKFHDPTFAPKTLLNFGSGVGSAVWSSYFTWGQSLQEYFCIDSSNEMNTLAQLLLQDAKEDNTFLKGLFFRSFLPSSSILKYDLVVTAYTLLELPSSEHRLKAIENLWHKTQDVMIIIENGSTAGYTAVLEARDYILQLGTSSCDKKMNNIHVVAPCPHEFLCPRFTDGTKTPCNFEVCYQPLSLNNKKRKSDIECFSYVILRKGQQSIDEKHWPRIVRPVHYRSKHVVCQLCCSDGELHELIFTKKKHGRHLYRCARSSLWGDLLPAKVIPSSVLAEESVT